MVIKQRKSILPKTPEFYAEIFPSNTTELIEQNGSMVD